MKHLAYNKQDAETFDRAKAAEFLDRFTNYCMQVSRELATVWQQYLGDKAQ